MICNCPSLGGLLNAFFNLFRCPCHCYQNVVPQIPLEPALPTSTTPTCIWAYETPCPSQPC